MTIQPGSDTQLNAIVQLHRKAFGASEGPAVATLVNDLLHDQTAPPCLSYVAMDGSTLVGHILFSDVHTDSHITVRAAILAPLAVDPQQQGQGIGTALIAHGLTQLKAGSYGAVFVLGDPAYYGRSGFHTRHSVLPPYPLPYPEAWQALELHPGALDSVSGTLRCAASLQSPEHW